MTKKIYKQIKLVHLQVFHHVALMLCWIFPLFNTAPSADLWNLEGYAIKALCVSTKYTKRTSFVSDTYKLYTLAKPKAFTIYAGWLKCCYCTYLLYKFIRILFIFVRISSNTNLKTQKIKNIFIFVLQIITLNEI